MRKAKKIPAAKRQNAKKILTVSTTRSKISSGAALKRLNGILMFWVQVQGLVLLCLD